MKRSEFLYLIRKRYTAAYFQYSMFHKADVARGCYDYDAARYFASEGRRNRAAASAIEDVLYEFIHGDAEDVATLDTLIESLDDVAEKDVKRVKGHERTVKDLEEFVEKLDINTLED